MSVVAIIVHKPQLTQAQQKAAILVFLGIEFILPFGGNSRRPFSFQSELEGVTLFVFGFANHGQFEFGRLYADGVGTAFEFLFHTGRNRRGHRSGFL